MPKLMQTAFNGGEWSGLLEGRTDYEKYPRAVYQLENMVLDPRGPATLRPGFRYVASAKNANKTAKLVAFDFGADQSYLLEFGDQYVRFYRNGAQITSGGSPYEIATTYTEAQLSGLDVFQSFDVLYILHASHPPRKLSRTGHTAWVLSAINFRPPAVSETGHELNAGLTLSALTGSTVTVTANASVFITGDVGRVIVSGAGRASIVQFNSATVVIVDVVDDFTALGIASGDWSLLGSPNGNLVPNIKGPVGAIATLTSTTPGSAFTNLITTLDYWVPSGKGVNEYYLQNTSPQYQASKPDAVYEDGVSSVEGVLDSLGLHQWGWGDSNALGYNTIYVRLTDGADPDSKANDYLKCANISAATDLFRTTDVGKYIRIHNGFIKITVRTSATSVKGEIIKELVAETLGTTNWTLEGAAWSAANGYPSCGCFFAERLCLAGSTAFPDTVWGSVVGDYENFTPGTDDSDSFVFSLGARKANVIRWIEPDDFLMIGTMVKVWKLGATSPTDPLTPLNVSASIQSPTRGCEDIPPQQADTSILYVQRHGRKIRELTWSWENEKYVAPDLALLAEHITEGIISGIVYQEEPNSILWAYQEDGSLIGMTYLRNEDVIGWHRHPMSGEVESLAVIPGDGYDELWALIKRIVNGNTYRYVEVMAKICTDDADTYKANKGLNAFYVDSGITYNGASTTTITGLGHLEGEQVDALADGAYVTTKTVASGQITLPVAASIVHVGLPYSSKLVPMRLNTALQDGTAQARYKKIHEVNIRVYRSGPFKVGRDEDNLDVCQDRDRTIIMGAPYELFTGDIPIGYDDNWETDGRITIVQDKPMPLTVTAIIYDASVS